MSEPLTIVSLPDEILLKIFGFVVDITTITQLRDVCKKIRYVYDNLYCSTVKEISLGEETGVTYLNFNIERLIKSIKMFYNLKSFIVKYSFTSSLYNDEEEDGDRDLVLENIRTNIKRLILITGHFCPDLDCIYFDDDFPLTNLFVIEICDICQNLKAFTFGLYGESDYDTSYIVVDDIIESFTKIGIQFYEISSRRRFNLNSLKKILNSPIKSLMITDEQLEEEHIDFIIRHKNKTMKELIINCYVGMGFQITEKNMIRIAASFPNLKILKLTSYRLNVNPIGDIGMKDIESLVSNCPNLETIQVSIHLSPGTKDYRTEKLLGLKLNDIDFRFNVICY